MQLLFLTLLTERKNEDQMAPQKRMPSTDVIAGLERCFSAMERINNIVQLFFALDSDLEVLSMSQETGL